MFFLPLPVSCSPTQSIPNLEDQVQDHSPRLPPKPLHSPLSAQFPRLRLYQHYRSRRPLIPG